MPPFISWFLYLSWIFLFISVGCLLKWLDMQPHPQHVALSDITSPPSTQHIASYSTERVTRIGIKVCLVLSIAFLVLHFIVILVPLSSS
jgi:hypothetical protein